MKQALTETLAYFDENDQAFRMSDLRIYVAAARLVERLLPGECGYCEGRGLIQDAALTGRVACGGCRGSGRVWDEGIVRVIQVALAPFIVAWELDEKAAREVLSAIAQLAEAGSQ